jgi:arylsulfatase A-like enzyme
MPHRAGDLAVGASMARKPAVTGAAGGLGRATPERLIADGLHIVGLDIGAAGVAGMAGAGFTGHAVDLTDDQGYGVSGTFGGIIPTPTPTLDALAATGLRYTEMSSTALCSPSRAALITGRNHHSVGFGVITELSTGFPGYNSIIGPESATIGRILKDNGYATSWFGKNHNTPSFQYTLAGPFDQWPSGMGFDYFYGFMGGETDQWTPYLFENNRQVFPFVGHEGKYNLTTDLADKAVE